MQKSIGMNSMVKVNLPGKLMKIITLSEKDLVELFVTPMKYILNRHSDHISKHSSSQKNNQIKSNNEITKKNQIKFQRKLQRKL